MPNLFGGGVALCPVPTSPKGRPLPGSLALFLREPPLGRRAD
ncbi:MAG TPA: hypothetical protein VGK96_17615 [Candidatus Sulfotelmatobacter sp.]